ncbi:MAG: SRPBCC family protein [Gordonia sp. (in: high G+C Gram-positive bacteria)]|uniref:SRPBCC family protein n=1 Tax=Gordonia sp. (in: high G+C Gram-positive bacteria) TaxID=84139 RepID=UPI003BB5286C
MGEVKHEAVIKAPREQVFAYINDYHNVPDYFFGVSRFQPLTDQTSGAGATFETALKVGPKELKSTLKCTDWVENELIELVSTSGFGASTTWRTADGAEAGTTTLAVVFTYTLPGGLAGKLLSPLMGPFAEQAVKHSENKIRDAVEG